MGEYLIKEFREELYRIAQWWSENGVDTEQGGFIGEININNQRVSQADKGAVLNARILWFFSELCLFAGSDKYKPLADRAYHYLQAHFIDREYGGVYWALDYRGNCVNDRKQVYAQAFALYGLSAYYRLSSDNDALLLMEQLYTLIENSHDDGNKGYVEAFDRQWGSMADMRLSDKDINAPKTMNTHLHILEAYTAFYIAKPSAELKKSIQRCLGYFFDYIIDQNTAHLRMFQDNNWNDLSQAYSFGHDIEASWLIWEALEAIADNELSAKFKPVVLSIVEMVLRDGCGADGEVLDAYHFDAAKVHEERVWWVQAEALVGFYNAYRLAGEARYLEAFNRVWQFIKLHQRDSASGEWHWLSLKDRPRHGDCKIGFWKGPYHNGRAMMEVCKLISKTC